MQTQGRTATPNNGTPQTEFYRASAIPGPKGSGPAIRSLDRGSVNGTWMGQTQAHISEGAITAVTPAIDAGDDSQSVLDEMPVAFRLAAAAGLVRLRPTSAALPQGHAAAYERQLIGGLARTLARGPLKTSPSIPPQTGSDRAIGSSAI